MAEDPLVFCRVLWPDVRFYNKQEEIIYSVKYNIETMVPAGQMLGKDFVSGAIALGSFIAPATFLEIPQAPGTKPEVRVVTTSVKDDHLRVLWGEINRFIATSRLPLVWMGKKSEQINPELGGFTTESLIVNHRDIRKRINGKISSISYLTGMVSQVNVGMAGHHAAYTLALLDEASGIENWVWDQVDGWAKRKLAIGNCWPTNNFFKKGVERGDILLDERVVQS